MREALPFDLQRFAVVAFAVAFLARHIDVGQEVHFDLDQAVAAAGFAAAALDVERKTPGFVAARRAFGQLREPVADVGERAGIGRGVRPWRAADGRLVDVDHLVAMFEAGDLVMRARDHARAVQRARRRGVERVDGEARLARTRYAGDAAEGAERDARGDILQVVGAGVVDGQLLLVALAPRLRDRDFARAVEIIGGQRFGLQDHVERVLRPLPRRRGRQRRGRGRPPSRRCGSRLRHARRR